MMPPQQLASEFAGDVRAGLLARPKAIPPRWLYDDLGSALFEAITNLPEYYLTRTELGILDRHAEEMLPEGGEVALVELGSGSARKTRALIRPLLRRQGSLVYCPIDISAGALAAAGPALASEFPELTYKPVVARYRQGLAMLRGDPRPKLVLFLGSSVGNFDPPDAAALLRDLAAVMGPRDRFLLGTDMDKDPSILLPAYDDAQGVTAAFIRNLLGRINRELGGDFDLRAFAHRAEHNRAAHRMEMSLVSSREQRVRVAALGLEARFAEGEALHTENSYKFTRGMVEDLVAAGSMVLERSWHDPKGWFGLHRMRLRSNA